MARTSQSVRMTACLAMMIRRMPSSSRSLQLIFDIVHCVGTFAGTVPVVIQPPGPSAFLHVQRAFKECPKSVQRVFKE